MTFVERIKRLIGPSESDLEIRRMVENCAYKNVRVVGRGTLSVDPQELLDLPGFKEKAEELRKLVKKPS